MEKTFYFIISNDKIILNNMTPYEVHAKYNM